MNLNPEREPVFLLGLRGNTHFNMRSGATANKHVLYRSTLDGALKCEWKLGCVCVCLLCVYWVPAARGKSQGGACFPVIVHMLLACRKTTVGACACVYIRVYVRKVVSCLMMLQPLLIYGRSKLLGNLGGPSCKVQTYLRHIVNNSVHVLFVDLAIMKYL